MIGLLVRLAVRRSLNDTRHIRVVKPRHAKGLVAEVYRQAEDGFGVLVPPTAMHSASPEVLAASWTILRETLLAQGFADRASREAVAIGVSEANSCPYCADIHGMTLGAIPDADPVALRSWANSSATGPAVLPCTPEQAPELVGVAVSFHYYNRMVNVFLRESPFPSHVPESAKPKAGKMLGAVMRPAEPGPPPGESVDLLPAAPLSDDLWWAAPNPVVASAFARAYAAIEAAGARSVPAGVRSLVLGRLSVWDGNPPGLSGSWADAPVATLPAAERAAGRLALTIALASYQVDDEMVAEFRRGAPDDVTLLELASWSSMAAARRVSTWVARARPAAA